MKRPSPVVAGTLCLLPLAVAVFFGVWIYRTREIAASGPLTPDWNIYQTRVTSAAVVGGDTPDRFPATGASLTGKIPRKRTADSAVCGQSGCHPDIVKQWQQSMHHLASFNNPLYRRSVDYTRERAGDAGVRWCAGCHDPVLLFAGEIDGPVNEKTPGADAGVSCVICHSTVGIQELTGNGRYILDVPDVEFLRPDHPLRGLVGLFLKVFPRPHKHGFLKPLHHQSEFCSSCHRVSIGVAQNHYRWVRGQDQFGGWLNGGASGRVARSFYTPKAAQRCQDCHMPKVASQDAGNHGGWIHSHSFPGANTTVPTMLGYPQQAQLSEAFIKGALRVDLIAAREVAPGDDDRNTGWLLPLERSRLTPGRDVRLDVVVRNLRVGHGFPEGVLDNKDAWLEVTVADEKGRPLSTDKCPPLKNDLPRSAHMYGGTLLDSAGQRIDKRNIADLRNTLFRRLVGSGQSDVAHYRFRVPSGVSALTFTAKLRYRKVRPEYARWVYAGHRRAGESAPPIGATADTTHFDIDPAIPVPEMPIVDVASDQVTVPVGPAGDAEMAKGATKTVPLAERLFDYGVAFFLHQDFPSARHAFDLLLKEAPDSPTGYFGMARAALAEGDDEEAAAALTKVLALLRAGPAMKKDPGAYPRAQGLMGQALLGKGDYTGALRAFKEALRFAPEDRSLYVDIGFTYFQMEDFPPAIAAYQKALALDPDDLSAHSTLARIYQLLGKSVEAQREQRIFEGMREDISLDGTREKYLETHPDEALEVVSGHEHVLDGMCTP